MKRSRGWLLLGAALALFVLLFVGPFFRWGASDLLRQHVAPHGSAALELPATPVDPPLAPERSTPNPEPAASATPDPSRTPAPAPKFEPNPALVLDQGSIVAPDGIGLGCDPSPIGQYLTCRATEPGGYALTFYLYLPVHYDPSTKYPLVLIMEGGGERANPNNPAWLNRVGVVANPYAQVFGPGYPGAFSESVQGRWPSFVVIPQLVNSEKYVDVPPGNGSYQLTPLPGNPMRLTKEIVDTLQLVYPNIDPHRRYLTGLSMGGYGAWDAAERWPDYWAALAPIAGAGDPSLAYRLVGLPTWAFHSADDPVVPVTGSRDMIDAIRAAGGHPKYTEYANLGHGEWLAPYTIMNRPSPTIDFFSWLFAQHR